MTTLNEVVQWGPGQTRFTVTALDSQWARLQYPNNLGVIWRPVSTLRPVGENHMSEIGTLSTKNTPDPASITHVRLYVENGFKWIWGQTADGDMTTIYWRDRNQLAKSGGWSYDDTDAWEYGDKAAGGNLYELPKPLTVHWESVTSQTSGREYKKVKSVVVGLETNGAITDTPDLPVTAFETQDRLEALGPRLKAAKIKAADAVKARKEALNTAISAFQQANEALYDAETEAVDALATLTLQAKDLIAGLAKTGARGHILGGQYQINQRTYMVAKNERGLLNYLIEHRLLQYLMIDMNALSSDLKGQVSPLLPNMPVEWETDKSPQINWSKLPEPPLQDAPQPAQSLVELGTLNEEAANQGEA